MNRLALLERHVIIEYRDGCFVTKRSCLRDDRRSCPGKGARRPCREDVLLLLRRLRHKVPLRSRKVSKRSWTDANASGAACPTRWRNSSKETSGYGDGETACRPPCRHWENTRRSGQQAKHSDFSPIYLPDGSGNLAGSSWRLPKMRHGS